MLALLCEAGKVTAPSAYVSPSNVDSEPGVGSHHARGAVGARAVLLQGPPRSARTNGSELGAQDADPPAGRGLRPSVGPLVWLTLRTAA